MSVLGRWDTRPIVRSDVPTDTDIRTSSRTTETGATVRDHPTRTSEDGTTAVEYGVITAVVGLTFAVAGPELYQAIAGLLSAIFDSML